MSEPVRAAVVESPGVMRLREFPLPEVAEDDAVLRVDMTGVCGSDAKYFYGKVKHRAVFPVILGHEMVGRIARIGRKASAAWGVKEGDRVILEAAAGCGACPTCRSGRGRFCPRRFVYGSVISCATPPHLWGAYSEYLYLPPNVVPYRVPDSLPDEAAIWINTILADALRWVCTVGGSSVGHAVAVEGVGPIGLCCVIAAKEAGAHPIIATGLARDAHRLEAARRLGATHTIDVEAEDLVARVTEITRGRLADLVMEASGAPEAVAAALDLVGVCGSIILCGLTGGVPIPLDPERLLWKEARMLGVYSADSPSIVQAIGLADRIGATLTSLVTHRFPLDEAERAVRTVAGEIPDSRHIKPVVVP